MKSIGRRLLIAMLLGVAVYGVLVLVRGVGDVVQEFSTYSWWTFGAACGLAFSNYALRFLKWEYYLAKLGIEGVPKVESFLTFLSGFVLTVTPGKVGEVFKSYVLFQTRGVAMTRTAPIVVAERVTDLIGVIALIAIGSLSFAGGLLWASFGTAVVIALLLFVASPRLSGALVGSLHRLPGVLGRLGERAAPKITESLEQLRTLTTPRRLVWPALLSVASWALEGLGLWVILGGFDQRAPLGMTTFVYATATLAGALVPVPGGLGVTDKVIEEGMVGLGSIPAAIATSSMLLIRFATLWFAVVVGFIALGLLRRRHPTILGTSGELEELKPQPSDADVPPRGPSGKASGVESPKDLADAG